MTIYRPSHHLIIPGARVSQQITHHKEATWQR